jgi:hypothetical protein
MKKKDG